MENGDAKRNAIGTDTHRNVVGASLGGPFIKERFYLLNDEG